MNTLALATNISNSPYSDTASPTNFVHVSGLVTSPASSKIFPALTPRFSIDLTYSIRLWRCTSSLRRPRWLTATLHPCVISVSTIARPIPVVPQVIAAVLPLRKFHAGRAAIIVKCSGSYSERVSFGIGRKEMSEFLRCYAMNKGRNWVAAIQGLCPAGALQPQVGKASKPHSPRL